jgi:CBS domain-containing protein
MMQALVGSAAFLGGVVRMTISLTVILIEATNEVGLSFPIMISLMVAKWVGDIFNKGIYDIHIHLKKIPLLEHDVEIDMHRFVTEDAMITDVHCFEKVNKLSNIVDTLKEFNFNGFPIITHKIVGTARVPTRQGRSWSLHGPYLGNILRQQVIVILQNKGWGELCQDGSTTQKTVPESAFIGRKKMHWTDMKDLIHLLPSKAEMENLYVDFRPYLNYSPHTLTPQTTLSRAYKMFRGLGLRHVMVVDENTNVIGMITRKELTIHRVEELVEELNLKQTEGHLPLPPQATYMEDHEDRILSPSPGRPAASKLVGNRVKKTLP